MKLLFLALILTFVSGSLTTVEAQTERQVKILVGKQKKVARTQLTVKFLSLIEDSRCPSDAQCVSAGNARIKVSVQNGTDPAETFEMNTNFGAKGANYGQYAVYLTDLTPTPNSKVRINRNAYAATFSVSRLTR